MGYRDPSAPLRVGRDDKENEFFNNLLKTCLISVFTRRDMAMITEFTVDDEALSKLQKYWEAYITKTKLTDSPKKVEEIILMVNEKLKELKNES